MTVLGIDPGLERMGFGVVQKHGSHLSCVSMGCIVTPKGALSERLLQIYERIGALIETARPEALAIEQLFFSKNQTTAISVAAAAGVVQLCAAQHDVPVFEYPPPVIKQAVVGYGNAEKQQVQYMVVRILKLDEVPKPDDVADALAIAITHAFRSRAPRIAPQRVP